MVQRRRKKKNKLRGHRTHGAGNTKNRRGKGSRGGKGRAGSKKHKFTKYYMEFVKGHKKRLKPKTNPKTINLDDLSKLITNLLALNKIEKEKDLVVVDGTKINYDKILSRGKLSFKILVRNIGASRNAIEKIKESKGLIEGFEESAAETIEE